MYKIDKNVPMPVKDGRGRPTKYPLLSMKVGDSFLIPFTKRHSSNRSIPIPYRTAERLKIKIISRSEKNGVRIWRME